MPRKPGLPICQHITLGLDLLKTREQIMTSLIALSGGYAKSSKAVLEAGKALKAVDVLRSELDNTSCREHDAAGNWSPTIYYGANPDVWEREVAPILRRHREGNPECCAGTPEPTR